MFSGSYSPIDVKFLLKPISANYVDNIGEKENLIQSGKKHYSELLSPEKIPTAEYLDLFHRALAQNRQQMANDCICLAKHILNSVGNKPILVSLARAGTPIGAILGRYLRKITGNSIEHYSISILRGRGLDFNALDTIIKLHGSPQSIVFIDGWTGKGGIAFELTNSLKLYSASRKVQILPRLFVLSDVAGVSFDCASFEDYLIPSAILNATISGLISRTLQNSCLGSDDFHATVLLSELATADLSNWFIDEIEHTINELDNLSIPFNQTNQTNQLAKTNENELNKSVQKITQFQTINQLIDMEIKHFNLSSRDLLKIGIGESTRVMMRRLPQRLIIKQPSNEATKHLIWLADKKNIQIEIRPDLAVQAMAIIKEVSDV